MKIEFQSFGWQFAFVSRNLRTVPIEGYTNRCKDGSYVIFLDYDDIESFSMIEEEILFLQEEFGLSDFFIFKSNKGFHAICFDKVNLSKLVDIMSASSIDPLYLKVPLKNGGRIWCLRYSKKKGFNPRFYKSLDSHSSLSTRRIRSRAHIALINFLFVLNIPFCKCDDSDINDIMMARYSI